MTLDLRARLAERLEARAHPLREVDRTVRSAQGVEVLDLTFRTVGGEPVRGVFCRPTGRSAPLPAVLVIHAHGNAYGIGAAELMEGRPALVRPVGPDLAAMGIQSLCLDMPCFGQRAEIRESAAAKAALWRGGSLAGQMIGESVAALDWLSCEAGVDPHRIGVFGLSMGATLGYWLAAVDTRVAALVQECCFADFDRLIAVGAHDLHGIYLCVPGLPGLASNGEIAGLVAPRAQFIGWGERDPLTPPLATAPALAEVRAAYAARGGRLVLHREMEEGHRETAAMRAAAMQFFREALASD